MKREIIPLCAIICLSLIISCKKDIRDVNRSTVTQRELDQINALGFSPHGVIKIDSGYLVEGDIFLSNADLAKETKGADVRIAQTEQYRTTNLVTTFPLSYRLRPVGSILSYAGEIQAARDRFNALNLQIKFSYGPSWGLPGDPPLGPFDIKIVNNNSLPGLGSSGFPSGGLPYKTLTLNQSAIGGGANSNYITTIIAHELGHCIGFRHTDYMDRSFSGCLVDATHPANEGDGGVGAVHIPGTPTTPDAGSWMLACIGFNVNRPFNANDIIALNYLY